MVVVAAMTPDAASAGPSSGHHRVWSPFPLPKTASVPGHPAGAPVAGSARPMPATRPLRPVAWPTAHTIRVTLPGAAGVSPAAHATSAHATSADAAAAPVTVSGTGLVLTSAAPGDVTVAVAGHAAAVAAGVDGVIADVSGTGSAKVVVHLDPAAFASAYGGDWAASLHLVALPACALTTPSVAACRTQTPVEPAGLSVGSAPMVVAATAGSSSPNGSYTATSLKTSDTWSAGGNTGSFTYSVPITVPATLGGSTPAVALSYDSGSVDGETVNANSQASWIGDGWSYDPGFIERSFQPCTDAGHQTGDVCWKIDNATLAGGPHSGPLVRNDANGAWRLATDDGTTVQELNNAAPGGNGSSDGSYWLITTPDGTKYFYGAGHLPTSVGGTGADPATNSAFTEPIYATASGQPCYSSSGFSSSWCQQAYRWNLDYVVDPHGNTTVYTYAQETGYYARGYDGTNAGTITPYVRAGDLRSIGYGWRTADVATGTSQPAAKVNFGIVERCMGDPGGCSYADLNSTTAGYWRDTPYYLNCPSSGTCTQYSPTFWSTRMLDSITTDVLVAGAYQDVDTYKLNHSWPEPGDGYQASLWLDSVQRTGHLGTTTLSNPAVTFTGTQMVNRVPGRTVNGQALPAMYHWRIQTITDELGAKTTVTYSTPTCAQSSPTVLPSSPDANTMLCYPVAWTPSGGAITDWFNKYLVTSVTVADGVGATASPAQVTNYQYVGDPAWHDNDSEFVETAHRTWDQWRGYQKVIVITGATPDPITQTQTTYLRGMDGDLTAAGGTKSVTVTDSQGNTYRDADTLNGSVIETQTYAAAGGGVVRDVVNTPYASAPVATHVRPSPLPAQVAVQTDTTKTVTREQITGGGWRTHEIDYGYDPAHGNRLTTTDDKGDGSASVPETCTTTKYATSTANPVMITYPYEALTVAGGCATAPGATTTLSDAITLYDGNSAAGVLDNSAYAAGTVADVTGHQIVTSYTGTTPVYLTTSSATFDAYGRTLTSTDPNADPAHPGSGVTITAYTPTTGVLPTQARVTDPKGFATVTTVDPTRSQPTEIVDANGRVTDLTYDPLGRLTQVWMPGRSMSANPGSPNEKFTYSLGGGTAPSYTLSQSLLENGTYTSSFSIVDGFGQVRQTQTNTLNGVAGRLITDTFYDSHGWTVKNHATYFNSDSGPSGSLQVTDDNVVPGSSTTTYDGLGRAVSATTYQFAKPQSTTTTAYPGADRTDVTPPTGIAPTSTFTDVRGHTTALWRYTTATVTGVKTDADVMGYTFDAAGRQTGMVDPNGDTWTTQYDLRGRKTLTHDPDSGDTVTAYDDDNRVVSTKDATGTYTTTTYDVVGRRLTEYTGTATPGTGTEVASWTYDTGIAGAKGQLVSSTSYHGGVAYTSSVTGYTPTMAGGPYTVTGAKITIPAGDGNTGVSGAYTASSTFTPNAGLPYTTTLPAAGGLPQEVVTSAYNVDGQLVSVGSSTSAVTDVAYDPFGHPVRTTLGTEPNQAVETFAYDAGSGRLLTQTYSEESMSTALDTVNTYYDTAGQITASADARSSGGTDLQCFAYDYAGRLKTAWTDTGTVTSAGSQWFPNTGACANPAPTASTAAAQIGGPAPYWQTYGYRSNGDRSADTSHNVAGVVANDVSHAYHYPAASNLLQSVTTTGPSGTSTDTYGYYANGATSTRTRAAGGNQSFGYDSVGHVATETTGSASGSYVYDANGALLVQHDPGETVLYLAGQEIHVDTATQVASGIRYISGPGGVQSIETGAGGITYTLGDPHNTMTLAIDGHTQAVTRRAFDPYGNARGTGTASYANGTWPDEHTFLGKPTDASSGLTLIGPRQYDSTQGRFLQPDPVMETTDMDQVGGYTYAADDPVNGSDPTGLMWTHGDGPDGQCTPGTSGCYGPVAPGDNGGGGGGGTDGGGGTGDSGSGCSGIRNKVARQSCTGTDSDAFNDIADDVPPATQYDLARELYFNNAHPDKDTSAIYWTDPGPDNGIIVIRGFIPEDVAVPFVDLHGDSRDFSTAPGASSRFAIAWDTATGRVSYTVYHTNNDTGYFPAIPIKPGGSNSVTVSPFKEMAQGFPGSEGIDAKFTAHNSALACCNVDGEAYVGFAPGHAVVVLSGDAYPNIEVIQYRKGQDGVSLAQSQHSWLGGPDSVPGVGSRVELFDNGSRLFEFRGGLDS
jgi:RHS repeat-associated protein